MKGKVYLIGAGPGDPGLLTVKGRDILARADILIYDALVNEEILEQARPGAKKIYVGKRGGQPSPKQKVIHRLLKRFAQQGKIIARLKGGDPFLFGRGGEEALFLYDQDIPFEIVPGVTSALGAPAYAGIPLTERNASSMVTIVTGHEREDKEFSEGPGVDWSRLSRKSTLVILMGVSELPAITDRLLHLNWHERTPAAVIRYGTLPIQQTIEGTLGDIAKKVQEAKLTSPAIIVIGKVARLRARLRWFDTKPLFGKTIVITRALEQAGDFAALLEAEGAEALFFPTIQLVPPTSWKPLDRAIQNLPRYDWLVFTSSNGAHRFFERMETLKTDLRQLKGVKLAAIGPKTAAQVRRRGLQVDALPEEYVAEALVPALGDVRGQRILIARAEVARDVLPKTLAQKGARVDIVPVYRTVKPRGRQLKQVKDRLLTGDVDVVTFTSTSTVENFMGHFSPRERKKIFESARAATIGPITAKALQSYGFRPAVRAGRYTVESLARAIIQYLK